MSRFHILFPLFCVLITCGCPIDKAINPVTLPKESPPPSSNQWLTEISAEIGIDFRHQGGTFDDYEMPAIMGSGCSLTDFDLDGRLDIYFVNGRPVSPANAAGPVQSRGDAFYRSIAEDNFVDVRVQSGVNASEFGMGAWWGDFDQDGFPDLFLTNVDVNRLFHNQGDGTFAEIPLPPGIAEEAWSTAACWFDLNSDGLLDLFIVNYVDYVPGQYCDGANGSKEFCGPSSYPGTVDRVLINSGAADHPYVDQTLERGFGNLKGKGLAVVAEDFNLDGRVDLYVSNDMESNRLWIQQEDGSFEDHAVLLGVARNFLGEVEASMGTITHDWNDDQIPDLFLCHLTGETNTLYLSERSSSMWRDATASSGLGPSSLPVTAFGVAATDLEHDGDLDLLIVCGGVKRNSIKGQADDPLVAYAQQNALYIRSEEAFQFEKSDEIAGAFAAIQELSRGLAVGDLNNDGDVDFVISNCFGPARVYDNIAPKTGSPVMLKLIDTQGNRDSIGARVKLVTKSGRAYQRTVNPCQGYLTQNEMALHFSLGSTDTCENIEIVWPDGEREMLADIQGGQRVHYVRGQGKFLMKAFSTESDSSRPDSLPRSWEK